MSKLTDEQINQMWSDAHNDTSTMSLIHVLARAIEAAATEPLLQRIAELEANEKVLLAQVQGHTQWREKIIKASEQAYGESAIRYKFSLTKNGKCMNTFPKEIDGRWFALVPAEDDGHIGHVARIAELERQLEEARKDAERYRFVRSGNVYIEPNTAEIYMATDAGGKYYKDPRDMDMDIDEVIDAAMQKGQS